MYNFFRRLLKTQQLAKILKDTKKPCLLVIDVDGVLTNGSFIYGEQGKLFKIFGSHDADALNLLRGMLEIQFITADTKGLMISQKRIDDMGYTLELVKSSERQFYLKEKSRGFRTIFVADSFTDVSGLKVVDFGVVPANGHSLAKKSSDLVLKSKGGDGAVAEVCLLIWGLLNK